MDYKLNPLLQAALDNGFPLALDAAATKAACENDILLDENQMGLPEGMTSQNRFLALYRHRRFCEEVLTAANHAISENLPLELSGQTMATLVATLIVQDK